LSGHRGRWCRLLRLCRGYEPDSRERRGGDERTPAQQQIAAFHSATRLRRNVVGFFWRMLVTMDVLLLLLCNWRCPLDASEADVA